MLFLLLSKLLLLLLSFPPLLPNRFDKAENLPPGAAFKLISWTLLASALESLLLLSAGALNRLGTAGAPAGPLFRNAPTPPVAAPPNLGADPVGAPNLLTGAGGAGLSGDGLRGGIPPNLGAAKRGGVGAEARGAGARGAGLLGGPPKIGLAGGAPNVLAGGMPCGPPGGRMAGLVERTGKVGLAALAFSLPPPLLRSADSMSTLGSSSG